MRLLVALVLAATVAAGAAFLVAGREAGPAITIEQPGRLVGLSTPLAVVLDAPGGRLSHVEAVLEQEGRRLPLFRLDEPGEARIGQETADRIRIERTIGRRSVPDLQEGPARLVVTAERPVLFGLRTARSAEAHDVEVRLTPPRLSVASTHHYINHGGAELVVYRVTPADADSGVRVGEMTYPGFPAAAAGVAGADASLRVALFALLHDQDLTAPIELYARDEAGNTARAAFEYRPFPRVFRRSRIALDDRFLQRVVPAIVEQSPELGASPDEDLLPLFLKVNGDLRRMNAERIAAIAGETAPELLWRGPFQQLGSTKVESGFADHRTYYYAGREVDRQVHLGFDLASTANAPILAANRGRVIFADYLGIYGNTVILDHGLGLHSLYSHLSSIEVRPGDLIERNGRLGRSGMTGLAGGDHLHFAILLQGHPVNPVEWWDPKWMEDRVSRKLRQASAAHTD